MYRFLGYSARLLIVAVFCFGLAGLNPVQLFAAEQSTSGQESESVDSLMAGLSDEQVRELLIEELKKDIEEEEVGPQKMKGPAFILSRLLRVMSSQHDDSEDEVRALFSSLPTMGSDLYRVFVKL